MKRILITALLAASLPALAHPGRTAGDGCHYCRTNCDSWGVPWNARHCHGYVDENKPEVIISKLSSLELGNTDWPRDELKSKTLEHGHSHEGDEQHSH